MLSARLAPSVYNDKTPLVQRLNWDIRVASTVHALIVGTAALWLINTSSPAQLSQASLYSNRFSVGTVIALSAGYFIWDSYVCIHLFGVYGAGYLLHGLLTALLYTNGLFPFSQYWGLIFLLFELSTPFVNLHWWFDKVGMSGSKAQVINGLVVLLLFFGVRLVFGMTKSYQYIVIMYSAWLDPGWHALQDGGFVYRCVFYSAAAVILNCLNVYWFAAMVRSILSRVRVNNCAPHRTD